MRDAESRHQWIVVGGTALFIGVFYLSLTPLTTLWDRDEPRFARAAAEMVSSGQYLYPTFEGELRPQKPILIYWLMTASIRVFGINELAVRCWSPLAVALAALFTYVIGRQIFSPRAAWFAMAVVAFNPVTMMQATAATTDAVLLASVAAAMAAFGAAMRSGPSLALTAALTVALIVAQLVKGPIGLAVPLVAMAGTIYVGRHEILRLTGLLRSVAVAAAASVAGFALWALPADALTSGRYLREGLGREVLLRATIPFEGHGGNRMLYLPFYLAVVLLGFVPWTLFLPTALTALRRGMAGWRARALLLPWIALPLVFFSLAATKLPHYILPIWPALALAVAGTLQIVVRESRDASLHRYMAWGRWLWLLGVLVGGAVLVAIAATAGLPNVHRTALAAGAVIGGFSVLAFRSHARDRFAEAANWLLAGIVVTELVVGAWLLPAIEPLKPVPAVAAAIRRHHPSATPVFTYEFGEPSLDFYLHGFRVRSLPNDAAVAGWARSRGPGVLVTTQSAWVRLRSQGASLPLHEIAAFNGVNYSKGHAIELVALEKMQ